MAAAVPWCRNEVSQPLSGMAPQPRSARRGPRTTAMARCRNGNACLPTVSAIKAYIFLNGFFLLEAQSVLVHHCLLHVQRGRVDAVDGSVGEDRRNLEGP